MHLKSKKVISSMDQPLSSTSRSSC